MNNIFDILYGARNWTPGSGCKRGGYNGGSMTPAEKKRKSKRKLQRKSRRKNRAKK